MRMPFEKLMELVSQELDTNPQQTIGRASVKLGETTQRIADAIDAVTVLRGEPTYVRIVDDTTEG